MRVRLSVMDDDGAVSKELTNDEVSLLIEALKSALWSGVKTGSARLPKGIEVAPV